MKCISNLSSSKSFFGGKLVSPKCDKRYRARENYHLRCRQHASILLLWRHPLWLLLWGRRLQLMLGLINPVLQDVHKRLDLV